LCAAGGYRTLTGDSLGIREAGLEDHAEAYLTMAKITRDAFLYLDPKPPKSSFAQCGTCIMWTGEKRRTCEIHGPDIRIEYGHSCGLYVHGQPDTSGKVEKLVTPEDSGLVLRQVRCENCIAFRARESKCGLFSLLNSAFPSKFDLDPDVDA